MFGPYRTPPESPPRPPPERTADGIPPACALLVLGGARVIVAATLHERWGLEPLLAACMCVAGIRVFLRRRR